MSSNIKVKLCCIECSREFIGRTTVTKYCSTKCNRSNYRRRIRKQKLEAQVDSTEPSISIKIEDFRNREFLTVTQVSKLIGCSRQNVYKLIRSGKLQATNLLEKKTIIKRKDLDEMFDNLKIQKVDKQLDNFSVADCYTLSEVVGKYDISEKALYEYIKRNNIPTLKEGWFVYVPKSIMDNIFGF